MPMPSLFSTLLIYAFTWWVVLFMVLPFGAQPPETPEPGHAPSAPETPRIKQKLLLTTLLAAVATGLICAVIALKPIPLDIRQP